MRNAAAFFLVFTSVVAMADGSDSLKVRPVRYVFTLNSNVLFCGNCVTESSVVALPTTIHGIRWKQLRVGAGIGYTSFGPVRAMPYFGSVTLNLFGKKRHNGIFVELNYGAAHAWVAPQVMNGDYVEEVKASNFAQLSAGYAFHFHGLRLAAQAGMHWLQTTRTYAYGRPYTYWWGTQDLIVPPQTFSTHYQTARGFLSISIGI
jgi:hypothetical protein